MNNTIRYLPLTLLIVTSSSPADQGPFIKEFFKPNDLVFDVGAHIGSKTEEYLKGDARVICIEPQPLCANILQKKFGQNDRITILQTALGEAPGIGIIWICDQAPTISTMSNEWRLDSRFSTHNYKWERTLAVPLLTLDSCIKQFGIPQFCKIDVENFELSVLRGLTQQIPYLSFEFASETLHNTKECLAHLQQLGYREFNVGIGEHDQLKLASWVSAEELIAILVDLNDTPEVKATWGLWGDVYARVSA